MKKTKGKKQSKVAVIALAALLLVGTVAGSLAYFSTTATFNNVFTVGTINGNIVETFQNPTKEQVAMGGTFAKSAKAVNTGDVPLLARAKVDAVWTGGVRPTPDDNVFPAGGQTGVAGTDVATLNFGLATATPTADFSVNAFTKFAADVGGSTVKGTSNAKWFYSTDGYFYYKDVLTKNAATSADLMKSVTVSNHISDATTTYQLVYNDGTADKTITGATEAAVKATFATDYGTAHPGTAYTLKVVTTSTYTNFAGQTLTVTITGDVIQADQATFDAVKGTASGTTDTKWNIDVTKTTWGLTQ
ncbi:MAG: BsaA family SipW-dependent biofilm matrix protein [Clostridia bacterium]